MKRLAILVVSIAMFSIPLAAQRSGGGGQGQRSAPRPGQGQSQGQSQGQAQGQAQGQGQAQQGSMDRQRQTVRATDQQRSQYETCNRTTAQVRDRAQAMAKTAAGPNPDMANLRQDRDQLRQQIQAMDRDMDQLRQGLGEEQRQQLQTRLKTLDREREQLRTHSQSLDKELNATSPNASRIKNRTQQVEQATERWQKQYAELGKDLGVAEVAQD